jgi:hypothetical protein
VAPGRRHAGAGADSALRRAPAGGPRRERRGATPRSRRR